MKTWSKTLFLLLFALGVIISCKDNPLPEPDINQNEASAQTQKVNQFIKDVMDGIYLWYKEMPDIDIKYELDSKEYFDKLLYTEDKWSYITEDAQKAEDSSHGIEKTFGYFLARGQFSNTATYFAVVEYVYPNSPAENAGLERGDFIVAINGEDMTESNYMELYNADEITITKGMYTSNGISLGNDISLTSVNLNLDPVIMYKVIEKDGFKIGYLFYAQFISDYNSSLKEAFQYFKDNNISDLIVDLRYNPGGYIDAAQYLCSSIAPLSVDESSTLVTLHFNDRYSPAAWPFLESNNVDPPARLGLDKVYFLTGQGTASASELTITGLEPYMDVVTVGDTTYGKYTAALFYTPDSIYSDKNYTQDIGNWGIQPIIARYANALGVTDFKDGFAPDFYINEYASENMPFVPLGEIEEPLLKIAIEDITGTPVLAMKKAHFPYHLKITDHDFSKYESFKRNLLLDKETLKNKLPNN